MPPSSPVTPRDVLLLAGGPGPLRARARALATGLRNQGHRVAERTVESGPRTAASIARRPAPDVVITAGGPGAHLLGLGLQRRGAGWVLDYGHGWSGSNARVEVRLVRSADAVLCATPPVLDELHHRFGAALMLAPDDDAGPLARQIDALASRGDQGDGALRVILLGPVNSPHVEHPALALRDRGVQVQVAGDVWPGLAPSVLPAEGVVVKSMTWPTPVWLRRLLREQRPDVVHAHWSPYAFHALVAGAHPLVATPWGSDVYRAEGRYKLGNVPVARRSDFVVTDSQDLIDAMIELGTPPEKTMVLNWGVDLQLFSPPRGDTAELKRALGLGTGPLVLSPRSLKSLYNPRAIVEAFRRVRESVPDAQLLLKHMNPDETPDLGDLPEGVHVIGAVPYEQMADYYRAADVCVSVPDTDSSPRSVWEAMACGCPCVVSDLPWARELIEPGRDALLVQVDPAEIADAVERVLTDPELAGEMATRGRALAELHRDRDRETDRLIALYERVAGRRK